jgi:mannose-6-phosphate isomerase
MRLPARLEPNQPQRFYRGGEAIARFRGSAAVGERVPEDWVGSTASLHGAAPAGLSRLPDGRLLCDAVATEPEAFLGPDHVAAFGADPHVLVKLLDAGERLPVHAHPDDAFARARLGEANGKSEAWLVLEAEGPEAVLHVGFREEVERERLRRWAADEDAEAMLGAMNELRVGRGDCVFVPAGMPHAIGRGVFMVEVQQPSDLGVLLEWTRYGIAEDDARLGLPWDDALDAVRATAVTEAELAAWTRRAPGPVVPPEAERFFRADWLRSPAELEPAFAVLVVVAGHGRLETEAGALEVAAGDTILVPWSAGAGALGGEVEAIRCRAPVL